MVLGDGHEQERKTSLRLAFSWWWQRVLCSITFGALHGLYCAWQSRRSKTSFFWPGLAKVGKREFGPRTLLS